MAQVNIKIDDTLKEHGEKLFSDLGMNISTAGSIFISQFFSENNMKVLRASAPDWAAVFI